MNKKPTGRKPTKAEAYKAYLLMALWEHKVKKALANSHPEIAECPPEVSLVLDWYFDDGSFREGVITLELGALLFRETSGVLEEVMEDVEKQAALILREWRARGHP